MNNNSNNGKGNQSDIITKKGFLISLPGKKKSTGTESSIHLAKPANEQKPEKNSSFGQKKNTQSKGDFKNNKHNNDNKKTFEENRDSNNSFDKKRKDKHHKNKGNNNQFAKEKDANVVKNTASSKNSENNNSASPYFKSFDNNNNKHRNDRRDRKNRGNNGYKRDARNDRGDLGQEKDLQNIKNTNNKPQSNIQKAPKTPALSALSDDIAVEARLNSFQTKDVFTAEQSLEEKYKNAKPLAEQIAEQEMRAKGIKIDTNPAEEILEQEIVGIRFREAGKIYYFDPDGKHIPFGTPVIVETSRGSEYGITAISNRFVPTSSLVSPLKKLERIATELDTQKHIANKTLEKDAREVFLEKVQKLGLAMNLIYVEYTFDNTRLLFYFTAETRIDFRELVKELASVFRTRIELRQIGVRDEAKVLGSLGVCGRATCCNTFLGDFAQVSIKMAKDQSLSLNAAKISGACGKLMCCLRYEDKVYEEENARTPRVGSVVETPEGRGHVVERNALKGIVNVQLDLAPEAPAKPFARDEVSVIGFNKEKSEKDDENDNLDELCDVE